MLHDPSAPGDFIRVSRKTMVAELFRILASSGFTESRAQTCAEIFTDNSMDGVYSHGINRFPMFIGYVRKGHVNPSATTECKWADHAWEQWDGNGGPGPLNAVMATDRAIELASAHGIGFVALANTNHWMRGGTYGWRAARKGFAFIGWSNTIANMPAFPPTASNRLGNNPLVLAIPYGSEAMVLDMALSQYSFGALEMHALRKQKLDFPGGYDREGKISFDPEEIRTSKRGLPIGYWKGAGLALMLDLLAVLFSGGKSTLDITKQGIEKGLSQVFICIALNHHPRASVAVDVLRTVLGEYQEPDPGNPSQKIYYPGQRVLQTRKENLELGIPVAKEIWEKILIM